MSPTAPSYSLTEAALVTGKSRVTIRRYLDRGQFPNAFRDDGGEPGPVPWRVPLSDLVAAGLTVSPVEMLAHSGEVRQGDTEGGRTTLQVVREQLATATALAAERERTIESLRAQVADLQGMLREAIDTVRQVSQAGR